MSTKTLPEIGPQQVISYLLECRRDSSWIEWSKETSEGKLHLNFLIRVESTFAPDGPGDCVHGYYAAVYRDAVRAFEIYKHQLIKGETA